MLWLKLNAANTIIVVRFLNTAAMLRAFQRPFHHIAHEGSFCCGSTADSAVLHDRSTYPYGERVKAAAAEVEAMSPFGGQIADSIAVQYHGSRVEFSQPLSI